MAFDTKRTILYTSIAGVLFVTSFHVLSITYLRFVSHATHFRMELLLLIHKLCIGCASLVLSFATLLAPARRDAVRAAAVALAVSLLAVMMILHFHFNTGGIAGSNVVLIFATCFLALLFNFLHAYLKFWLSGSSRVYVAVGMPVSIISALLIALSFEGNPHTMTIMFFTSGGVAGACAIYGGTVRSRGTRANRDGTFASNAPGMLRAVASLSPRVWVMVFAKEAEVLLSVLFLIEGSPVQADGETSLRIFALSYAIITFLSAALLMLLHHMSMYRDELELYSVAIASMLNLVLVTAAWEIPLANLLLQIASRPMAHVTCLMWSARSLHGERHGDAAEDLLYSIGTLIFGVPIAAIFLLELIDSWVMHVISTGAITLGCLLFARAYIPPPLTKGNSGRRLPDSIGMGAIPGQCIPYPA